MLCYLRVCYLRENFPGIPGPLNSVVVGSDRLVPRLFHHYHQCRSCLPKALHMTAVAIAVVKITAQYVDATRKT